jgi:hypothetical protein
LLISALSLTGAFLGLVVLGLPGFLLGAKLLGLAGALIGASWTKTDSTVRIRGRDAELYFVRTSQRPDALRMELSEPLQAIANARAAPAGESGKPADQPPGSIPDQLSKLASLLQQDLITRQEFDHLKANLMAAAGKATSPETARETERTASGAASRPIIHLPPRRATNSTPEADFKNAHPDLLAGGGTQRAKEFRRVLGSRTRSKDSARRVVAGVVVAGRRSLPGTWLRGPPPGSRRQDRSRS